MWTRRPIALALLAATLSGCVMYRYSSGEAACLEVIRGDDRLSGAELRWLRFWQSTPYCQAVRARWASGNRPFVPPTVMMLLGVRPLQCIRTGNVVQVTARFMNPANSGMAIDPFDAVVGSDPVQPPGSSNAGTLTPIDLQGNPTGPAVNFPSDLTGSWTVPVQPGLFAEPTMSPDLAPVTFPVRIEVTVIARIGTQIIAYRQRTCDVQ